MSNGIGGNRRITFYGDKLGARLTEYVQLCLSTPRQDFQDVTEEIALMRHAAGSVVKQYADIEESIDKVDAKLNPKQKAEMLALVGSLMSDQLNKVTVAVERSAKIEALMRDKFSIHTLQDIVAQIVAMVRMAFADFPDHIAYFESLIDNELRVPKSGVDGTLLTPDMDALAMDDTIPSAPPAAIDETVS